MIALLYIVIGIVLWLTATWAVRHYNLVQRWKLLARIFGDGGVPWASVRSVKALGEQHGTSELMFVSRHDIAECGLTCPLCSTLAAERGDFSGVRRMLVNGQENEVVKCPGVRVVEDERSVPCGVWLVASPDTEHGDHLGENNEVVTDGSKDVPEFYQFKRVTADQALREKYGLDVAPLTDGETGMQIDPNTMTPIQRGSKNDVLTGEDLLNAVREATLKKEADKVEKKHDLDATPITNNAVNPGSPYV